MTPEHIPPAMPHPTPDHDRETLSALFDGELHGDAARFALKRLDHDAQWREVCGRWQLAGDVLRGSAGALAPADFAGRVAAALAAESAQAAPLAVGAPQAGGWRRGWIGGAALAASVAVAALFVARPALDGAVDGGAGRPAGIASAPKPDLAPEPVGPSVPAPSLPDGQAQELAAAAVAVAEVPRRLESRRNRARTVPDAARPGSAQPVLAPSPADPAVIAFAGPEPQAPDAHPFMPEPGEMTARPWPRAVLPNYPAGNALTASFERPAGGAFYPFEPRLPEAAEALDPRALADPPPYPRETEGPRP